MLKYSHGFKYYSPLSVRLGIQFTETYEFHQTLAHRHTCMHSRQTQDTEPLMALTRTFSMFASFMPARIVAALIPWTRPGVATLQPKA